MNGCEIGAFFGNCAMGERLIYTYIEHIRGIFRALLNTFDEVFLAEVVNVFQPLTIFAKKVLHTDRHNLA